ncbi:MAG: hypothetical protein U0939_21710 [Pirellulales bacterium]
MGRKAWLFVSNVESGEQSAMLMSWVSSAKRHDLDVWKRAHPEAVREYRVEERQQKA